MNSEYTQKLEAPSKYRHIAAVRFTGQFPYDMLRYDRCFPYRETDSGVIAAAADWRSSDGKGGGIVLVAKYSEHGSWETAWTHARWKSFGAVLSKDDISKVYQGELKA
jgi:hypothetical protein